MSRIAMSMDVFFERIRDITQLRFFFEKMSVTNLVLCNVFKIEKVEKEKV
tara:strand:+ start:451 stop:600 length:150 start_codon:yes stop_codon:yes gene_type:complete